MHRPLDLPHASSAACERGAHDQQTARVELRFAHERKVLPMDTPFDNHIFDKADARTFIPRSHPPIKIGSNAPSTGVVP